MLRELDIVIARLASVSHATTSKFYSEYFEDATQVHTKIAKALYKEMIKIDEERTCQDSKN